MASRGFPGPPWGFPGACGRVWRVVVVVVGLRLASLLLGGDAQALDDHVGPMEVERLNWQGATGWRYFICDGCVRLRWPSWFGALHERPAGQRYIWFEREARRVIQEEWGWEDRVYVVPDEL